VVPAIARHLVIVRLACELLLRVVTDTEAYEPFLLFVVYAELNCLRVPPSVLIERLTIYTRWPILAYMISSISTSHSTSTPSDRVRECFTVKALYKLLTYLLTYLLTTRLYIYMIFFFT